MPFHTYILKSTNHDRRYIGSAENVDARLLQHNAGRVRSSKAYKPYTLIYTEVFETRAEAFKREQFFKTLDGYNFLKGIGIY